MKSLHRVAHVCRRFSFSDWGGTESVIFHLCQELQKKGISSPVYTTSMLSHAGPERNGGLLIHRFPYSFPWLGLKAKDREQMILKGGSPLSLSLLTALIRDKDVDVIHTHVQHRLGGIARTVARWRGIPYVVSLHGGVLTLPAEQAEQMQAPFKGKFEWGKIFGFLFGSRRTLADADAIICVGKDEFEAMREKYPNKRVFYLPNGVNLRPFEKADAHLFRDQYGIQPQEKVISCISRIDYQKNQLLLIKAFAQFAQHQPNYRLVLIGPVSVPAYHNLLMETASRLGVESRITVIPGLAADDPLLASAYKASEFFVLPSRTEPFGIVILEAWAAGTPVIASRVGGIPGFTHEDEDILFFEDNQLEGLVEKMNALASQPELQNRLSESGRREVRQYSWEAISKRLLEIYQELLQKTPST